MNYKVKIDGKEVDNFIGVSDVEFLPIDEVDPGDKKMEYTGTMNTEFSNSFMEALTSFKRGIYSFREDGEALIYVFLEGDEVSDFIKIMGNPNKEEYENQVSSELLSLAYRMESLIVMQGKEIGGEYELKYEGTEEETVTEVNAIRVQFLDSKTTNDGYGKTNQYSQNNQES